MLCFNRHVFCIKLLKSLFIVALCLTMAMGFVACGDDDCNCDQEDSSDQSGNNREDEIAGATLLCVNSITVTETNPDQSTSYQRLTHNSDGKYTSLFIEYGNDDDDSDDDSFVDNTVLLTYFYDSEGRLSSLHLEADTDNDGSVDSISETKYYYNDAGYLSGVSRESSGEQGSGIENVFISHDSEGKFLRETYKDDHQKDGTIDRVRTYTYTYDGNGNVSSMEIAIDDDHDGFLDRTDVHTYKTNSKGQVLYEYYNGQENAYFMYNEEGYWLEQGAPLQRKRYSYMYDTEMCNNPYVQQYPASLGLFYREYYSIPAGLPLR